ncbi:hypothetical protein [Gloeocapsopsis dulcis]|nr:hypothetical protein [Gloeocapsopsis dulcis]WNN91290.1 hypothetical protein P0S91_09555 [Gloeocapsopsis dulcis]
MTLVILSLSVNAQIKYLLTEAARKAGRWQEGKHRKANDSHEEDE